MSKFIALRAKSNTIKKTPAGQSLIEAMVALTIIITSISSAMALVQSSITASRIGGSQVVAANLAREGVEVARSMRDSNWLAGNSFQIGLVDVASKTARPMLDVATGKWTLNFGALTLNDPLTTLYLNSDGAFLQANSPPAGSGATQYRRLLTLNYICRLNATGVERVEAGPAVTCNPATETLVGLDAVSSVRWFGTAGAFRVTTVEERFYDWR